MNYKSVESTLPVVDTTSLEANNAVENTVTNKMYSSVEDGQRVRNHTSGGKQQQQYSSSSSSSSSSSLLSYEQTPLKRSERRFSIANNAISHTIQSQLNEIWLTVQLKSVWRPMLFVYTFNLFQVPNVAWQSYLQVSLYIHTM